MVAIFDSVVDERRYRKQRLAGALRLFGKFGFDEGTAGHITVRDPQWTDHFWVNEKPFSWFNFQTMWQQIVREQPELLN